MYIYEENLKCERLKKKKEEVKIQGIMPKFTSLL